MTRHRFDATRGRKGETLVEVLVSLIIVTLATLLMVSMVTTSGNINLAARKKDEKFYEALTKVESVDSSTGVTNASGGLIEYTVRIRQTKPDPASVDSVATAEVHVYTSEDLTLYKEVGP